MSSPKRGRPFKDPEEVKRHSINFRTTKEVHERICAEADASGRSIAQTCEVLLLRALDSADLRGIVREEVRAALRLGFRLSDDS